MIVLLGVTLAIRNLMQDSEVFKNLVQAPWQSLSGMITAGNWRPPAQAVEKHPALDKNHGTLRGSPAQ